jgi:hypothetical protein
MSDSEGFTGPLGHIALTTYGAVTAETLISYGDSRAFCTANGLGGIKWQVVFGALVDKARNEAVSQMLKDPQAAWLLFFDADMTWPPQLVPQLLKTAYQDCVWADIVGGYCNLRGPPYLPTIDTGTGTWEPHGAMQGPKEVIRTGSACVLVKRHVYERMNAPWYGIRPAPRPLDNIAELDNYARIKGDGQNPLREHPFWNQLEQCAVEDAAANPIQDPNYFSTVGEDSNLCDRAKALGFRIVVDTNAVCQHIDRKSIGPADHAEAMRQRQSSEDAAVGLVTV